MTKVTLTFPAELLAIVDEFVASHAGTTRSRVCADALQYWFRTTQEAEIARYYASPSEVDCDGAREWDAVAAWSAERLWP